MKDHNPVEREFKYEKLKEIIQDVESEFSKEEQVKFKKLPKRKALFVLVEIISVALLSISGYFLYTKFSCSLFFIPTIILLLFSLLSFQKVKHKISSFLSDSWITNEDINALRNYEDYKSLFHILAWTVACLSTMYYLYAYECRNILLNIGLSIIVILIPLLIVANKRWV